MERKKIYNSDKKHFYFFLLFFRKEKINKYKKIKYFWKENRNLLYHIFLDLFRKRINLLLNKIFCKLVRSKF